MNTLNPATVTRGFALKLKDDLAADSSPRKEHELEYALVEEQQRRDDQNNDRRWGRCAKLVPPF